MGGRAVLRLLRAHRLLAPHRAACVPAKAHDGRIITGAPQVRWATDDAKIWTVDDGWVWLLWAAPLRSARHFLAAFFGGPSRGFILNPGMGTADFADGADGQALAVIVALTQWVSPPKKWRIRKFLNPRDLRDLRFIPSPFLGLSVLSAIRLTSQRPSPAARPSFPPAR